VSSLKSFVNGSRFWSGRGDEGSFIIMLGLEKTDTDGGWCSGGTRMRATTRREFGNGGHVCSEKEECMGDRKE